MVEEDAKNKMENSDVKNTPIVLSDAVQASVSYKISAWGSPSQDFSQFFCLR